MVAPLAAPLSALAQEAVPPNEPDGVEWRGAMPSLRLADGAFTLTPTLRLDADAGSFFGQDRAGGYRSGVNLRRGRLGMEGQLAPGWTYSVVWEFGGPSPNDYGELYEAQVAYTGLGWGTIRLGAFQPQHLPEYAGSSFDLPFLERAAISNIAASLASGSARMAAGLEARGERWNASAYVTGGDATTPHDHRQRGVAGRAVALLPGLDVQLGLNAAAQFHPGTSPGPESIRLRDYPELRVDSRRFLDSGTIGADSAWAAGPELAGRLGPLYVEALWQRVEVDATAGGTRRFEGWYAEAALPLVGNPRERSAETGSWKRPKGEDGPGALELAARYSTADLRADSRGARQDVWTLGLTWFPTESVRLGIQYENGRIRRGGDDRDFQAIGLRVALNL
nr:porin [Roseomonas rosea]